MASSVYFVKLLILLLKTVPISALIGLTQLCNNKMLVYEATRPAFWAPLGHHLDF